MLNKDGGDGAWPSLRLRACRRWSSSGTIEESRRPVLRKSAPPSRVRPGAPSSEACFPRGGDQPERAGRASPGATPDAMLIGRGQLFRGALLLRKSRNKGTAVEEIFPKQAVISMTLASGKA